MSFSEGVRQLATNAKPAIVSVTATISTGTATWLKYIPSDIGKLASIIGIILSGVLIYTHLVKLSIEKKAAAQQETLRNQEIRLNNQKIIDLNDKRDL